VINATHDNPFATRYVRPGAIRFVMPKHWSADALVSRLRANHWQGEITGPHGAGKSTLLATLVPALQRSDRLVRAICLADGNWLPAWQVMRNDTADCRRLWVIDGFEQLPRLLRWRWRRRLERREQGLLATAHRSLGLPNLMYIEPDVRMFEQLARGLLARRGESMPWEEIRRCYHQAGNAREGFFLLYDLYELRKRKAL